MKIINAKQGTPEWHEHRATTRNASDAPIMMGVSRYKNRTAFIYEKATGLVPDVDEATQRRFADGHAAESAARLLLEEDLGITLYPLVATDDDGYLGASSDGCTLPPKGGIGFEHKLWNESLAASVREGIVPESHAWQLDQQIAVFGFEKILFVVSDGTRENREMCEYRTTPERIASLIAGWRQLDQDVANYVPVEVIPAAVAAPIKDLPALSVQIVGNVMASNLTEWKAVVSERIQAINTDLQDDQDFADAAKTVTFLEDGEKKIDLVKSQAQSQAIEIDELFRALDDIKATMRTKRLELNKLVEKRKEEVRAEILMSGKNALASHIAGLNKRLSRVLMPPIPADFAGAMKGKRTVESLKNAVNTVLANAKIEADTIADRVEKNLATLDDLAKDHMALFADLAHVVMKDCDDFTVLVKMRIADHKAAEEKRLEAERERIRKEEQAKIEQEQAAAKQACAEPQPQKPEGETRTAPAVEPAAVSAPVSSIEQQHPVQSASVSRIVTPREKLSELLLRVKDDRITMVIHYVERVLTSQEQEAA